jgi:dipeptidyl aminopeptidase/acylaminoacyl peptidase
MRSLALVLVMTSIVEAKEDHVATARAVVEDMARGDDAAAVKRFGPELAKALDADKLAAAWKATLDLGGAFVAVDSTRVEPGRYEMVIVRCRLAKAKVDVWIGFKDGDAPAALHIDRPDTWTAPAYVDAARFTEREVVVGAGALGLPGTLAVPRGAGPFPALFLVHGSGPNDRDETSPGGARTFRDLAQGLASRGIVVLRYDKRTYAGRYAALGVPADRVTIKEEYLDDVRAAAALLRATKEVDAKRIYVLGHSEGGFLLPKLMAADPALAGGVVLAGTARHFIDILLPQFEYLSKVSGNPFAGLALPELRKRIERARDPALSVTTPASELPLELPASYWLSVRDYDPVAVARTLPQPLLVLQGERDYQVTIQDDFELWKQGLAAKANVTYVSYPKLNHYFFAGEGPITPEEYAKKSGHVEAKVVEDIARFVR